MAKSSIAPDGPGSKTAADLITAEAFARAFDGCRSPAPFALAVSGGPDSVTMMYLAARYCAARGYERPFVFTVDHQLRPEAKAEAEHVKAQATALGLGHETLVWAGPKPRENLQHAARMARYALMGEAMRRRGLWALMTGHTLDDQAETFLLRLGRGSGLDGLSGMAEVAAFPMPTFSDLCLLRPLLGFSKAQVLATAADFGASYVSDPSNLNRAFARTRAREAMTVLAEAGITPHRIAEAAAHLRRARAAIETSERELFARAAVIDPWGFALIDRGPLAHVPHEVALRFTASLLRLAGGAVYPPELDIVEGVYAWLTMSLPMPRGRTAAGCRLALLDDGRVLAAREQGGLDQDEPVLILEPGQSGVWDGRFRVSIGKDAPDGVYAVQALGPFSQSALKLADFGPPRVEPRRIAATYPGLFQDGVLIAVPVPPGCKSGPFSAQFLGRTPPPDSVFKTG